jgi:hypothetical protein
MEPKMTERWRPRYYTLVTYGAEGKNGTMEEWKIGRGVKLEEWNSGMVEDWKRSSQ